MRFEKLTAILAASFVLFWVLIPACYSVFVNSDQLISFFAWHLLKQEDTYLFFIAGAVQIVIPFRATVLTITAVFSRVSRETVKFMHPGHASLFVVQTAVLSYLGTLLAKATFSLDYVTATSRFAWPLHFFPRLLVIR
jgi:hypothetical protein